MFGEIGKIETNGEGLVMCKICGEYFHRVCSHTRQRHNVSAREYKKIFGLESKKGICSEISRKLSSDIAKQDKNGVISKNLLEDGVKSRFAMGNEGRTKKKLRPQTLMALKEHAKTNVPIEKRAQIMRENRKNRCYK
jgi:hypothetical protein